ncbi:MAG: hypothetical protein JO332_07930, partial [Planctomycetaceae bacterium]|nr:hypothetical protein [Planctomycetaceae bacterium]
IDEAQKTVTSATGELALNYGTGLCTINAPKAQGAVGFLSKAGPLTLKSLTVDSKNEYAAILAVPLDDKDLSTSGSVLVQVTTQCRPYHWKEAPATFKDPEGKNTYEGKRIEDTGSEPWNEIETQATLTIRNARLKKATALDPNGMPAGDVAVDVKAGALTLTLPRNALYVVLQ